MRGLIVRKISNVYEAMFFGGSTTLLAVTSMSYGGMVCEV